VCVGAIAGGFLGVTCALRCRAKVLAFRRPDRHADVERLLREFYAEERELENDPALRETVKRAKEIPRWLSLPRPWIP